MTSLSVSGLGISFGERVLLDNVSFSANDGDRVGIVGVNGCGKSTLFKIIAGEAEADCGNVFIAKGKKLRMLGQNDAIEAEDGDITVLDSMLSAFVDLISDEEDLKALEDELSSAPPEKAAAVSAVYSEKYAAFKERGGLEFRARCRSLLTGTGFPEETFSLPVAKLSGGQKMRLALARTIALSPDILMLDEPTNHLDSTTLTWLENYLSSYSGTVFVISHDRYFLDRVANKILEIEHGRAKLYNGGYTLYSQQKAKDLAVETHAYLVQQKEIARQQAYIDQQKRWNRERNIRAAESREKALARMEKLEKPKDAPRAANISISSSGESGNDVLMIHDLRMCFGDRLLFDIPDTEIKRGDRVILLGPNGCGKSTLIKIIMHSLKPTSGYTYFGSNVKVGYFDQENSSLDPNKTVLDEVWDDFPDRPQLEIRNMLASLLFRGDDVLRKVGVLSGGEKARVSFAKLMLSKMNLLILDEPTNNMDIPSRESLEEALNGFDGTIIAASHDRYFINRISNRIIGFDGLTILDCPIPDSKEPYSYYLSEKERLSALRPLPETDNTEPTDATSVSSKDRYLAAKTALADQRKSERRVQKLKEEAALLEDEIEKIEAELLGESASDYIRAAELDSRRTEIEERLLEIYQEIM
ncbi:MAG: ABC-F family ATP-binding cassette domain-containing protein [Clostridia bacterium]|nr:ABC-F family ATP-binding cassette domain-containing protein [Clostridia bacterium]